MSFLRRLGVLGLLPIGAFGCSAELDHYNTDADTGVSAHALVTVQRSLTADQSSAARAEVLAGFVHVPADVEARPLYQLLGLRSSVPAVGQCRIRRAGPEATPALAGLDRVELLEAGDVWVGPAGNEISLAPHAFPTVTAQISGVVYASRDRSSSALPALGSYSIRTQGSADLPALQVNRDAPPELDSVTVGGVALAEVKEVQVASDLDLTWGVGSAGDLIVAELSTSEAALTCAFRDDVGAGTIPGGKLDLAGPGRLALQRVRSTSFRTPSVDYGELVFQFELGENVTFKP